MNVSQKLKTRTRSLRTVVGVNFRKVVLPKKSSDLAQEEVHSCMTPGLPLCRRVHRSPLQPLWTDAMEVADAELRTLRQSLPSRDWRLRCASAKNTSRFLSNVSNCSISRYFYSYQKGTSLMTTFQFRYFSATRSKENGMALCCTSSLRQPSLKPILLMRINQL